MTDPFNQPASFATGPAPAPLPRTTVAARRPWLPAVGAVVIAVVAFGGGFVVANATAAKATTTGDGQGGGQGFGPNASGRPGRFGNGFGGGAAGTIGSVSPGQMTLTTAAGGQRIILLTPTTTVTQVSATTKAVADLTSGETVTVVGTPNPDGSVTATRVIVGDLGALGGRGGFGGPPPSAAPSTAP